ncbi:putative RNA binding protein YcfA (HicA-like mRNA interferase family) [Nitrosospira sp. Nsp2]|nr:putative RNA binding protein YcfA (HicA-like mRNA interferase family) [Nitrosospira sp. Nsp2]
MDSKTIMRLLRENGFEVDRIKGSHHQMRKEGWPVTVTVPHPKKQLGPGLVNAILKQAGLK